MALCKFGILSDIQYADIDDGYNYARTTKRYYRNALKCVHDAVDKWNEEGDIEFMLQLGDVVDGKSNKNGVNNGKEALDKVAAEWNRLTCPTYHALGNHEFYIFTREELMSNVLCSSSMVGACTRTPGETAYYHFSPVKGVRIVVLDGYDVSALGRDKESKEYKDGEKIIRRVNSNDDMNSCKSLSPETSRFVQFNGGLGEEQMTWLEETLSASDSANEIVAVGCHIPIIVDTSDYVCLLWNASQVVELLERHPSVKLYLSGHKHIEAYAHVNGIHHLTLPGIVAVPPGSNAFATLSVNKNRLEVKGYGEFCSRVMKLGNIANGCSAI